MYKRVIVLVGIFLGTLVVAAAQTPAPRIALARERVEPTMTKLRTASSRLPADFFLLSRNFGKSHFSRLFEGAYEPDDSLDRLLPMEEVKTVLFTRSSLPLVQLWSSRLQLDAFQNTLHIQNVQPYPVPPRWVHLSGLSLSFHFGRGVRTERAIQGWRCLPRIVGTALN